MSKIFDTAWDIVKMARHVIGPTEIWDMQEYTTPKPKGLPDETPDYGKVYYPLGGSPRFGQNQAKVMMTPTDFLGLVAGGNREERYKRTLQGQRKLMEQGAPIYIPNLSITSRYADQFENADFLVRGHEGRHRMQNLIDMGYGDTKVPVLISSNDDFGLRGKDDGRGGNLDYITALLGATLEPQADWEGNRGERSKQFTIQDIDAINRLWDQGEVEYLEKSDFYFGRNDADKEGGFWSRVGTQGYKGAEHLKDDKGYVTGVNLSHPIYQTEDPIERIIRTIAHEEGHEAIYNPLRETRELEFEDIGYEPTYWSELNPGDQQQEYGAMLMEGMKHDEIIEELRRRGFFDY